MATKRRARGAGSIRQLGSGRYQGRFRGPDGVMRPAPVTFDTRLDATAWLTAQGRDVDRGLWIAPEPSTTGEGSPLRDYAAQWLAQRDLKPRTRVEYQALLDACILPTLGDVPLGRLTPASVRTWHANLNPKTPTRRAHSYSLLRAIYTTAVA